MPNLNESFASQLAAQFPKQEAELLPRVPALSDIDRPRLHELSTKILISSYFSSFFVKSPASPLPFFLNGLTHPMIHRAGYNMGSGMQGLANLSQPKADFSCDLASALKSVSDVVATAAMVSSGVMLAGMAASLIKTPPKTMSRLSQLIGQTPWGTSLSNRMPFRQLSSNFSRLQTFLRNERFRKFIYYSAESSAGFCTTGALNASAAFCTITGAKLESDYNRSLIIKSLQQIDPDLSKKDAEEIFDRTVPHMHLREAGLRLLGTTLSGGGSVSSGLSNWSDKTKFLDPVSGFLFAGGLMASTWPSGNLPEEKRFSQDVNERYIRQNEITKTTAALLSVGVSAGFLWMLNGRQPPASFRWASGKLDNIVQVGAMAVAASSGLDPLKDTPAAARSLYGTNPRLRQQRETRDALDALCRGGPALTEGYAARLLEQVNSRRAERVMPTYKEVIATGRQSPRSDATVKPVAPSRLAGPKDR